MTLDLEAWPKPIDSNPSNFWLAEGGKIGKDQGFVMDLGCSMTAFGVRLRNTRNAFIGDRGTKKFRVLGSIKENGPWEELLVATIEDSRSQDPPPLQHLLFDNTVVISFVKFELLEYWGSGGGLQYFAIMSSHLMQPGFFMSSLSSRNG